MGDYGHHTTAAPCQRRAHVGALAGIQRRGCPDVTPPVGRMGAAEGVCFVKDESDYGNVGVVIG
jgi:hypothetical protein